MTRHVPVDFSEILLGNVRVGEVDVAFMQAPDGKGGHLHWWLAADDDGAVFAREITKGPIVPQRPDARRVEIAEHLAWHASRFAGAARMDMSGDRIVRAFEQGFDRSGKTYRLRESLVRRGLAIQGKREADEPRIAKALAPVRKRLGRRLELYFHYTMIQVDPLDTKATPLPAHEAQARILRLTSAETAGLCAFQPFNPLLRESIEMPDLRLDRAKAEIERDLLVGLGVTPAAARRARQVDRLTKHDVLALRSMPIDWLPRPTDLDGWEALTVLADELRMAYVPETRWKALVSSSKGDWVAFRERCAQAAYPKPLETPDSLFLAIQSAGDVESSFQAALETIFPESDPAGHERIAAEAVSGDRALPAILENSRLWHERFVSPAPAGLSWPMPLPRWKHEATGIEFVPLATSEELVEEGEEMRHCVGGEAYALSSLRGESLIVSLREDGRRVSTAEISMDSDADGAVPPVLQHMSHGNSRPPQAAMMAIRHYIAQVPVDRARRTPAREARLPAGRHGDAAKVLEAWRPYLTGKWRNASLEDFRSALPSRTAEPPEPDGDADAPAFGR